MILWLLGAGCTGPSPIEPVPVELVADAGPDRTVPVGVSVKLDGSASTGAVAWLWDAGDGTTYTTAAPTHIYRTPGNRTAILQVTADDGSTRTSSIRVTVHPPLAEVRPGGSSTLTVGPDGRVWGIVEGTNVLFVANAEGAVVTPTCSSGGEPRGVTVLPQISVLCTEPPRLVHFPFGSTLLQEVPLPEASRPSALAYRDGEWVVTLSGTGQIARITNVTDVSLTEVGPDPRSVVDLDIGAVAARFRSDADAGTLYLPGEALEVPYDTGPDSDTGNRGVPNLLQLAPGPDGRTVFVGGTISNTARGTLRDGQDLTFETTVRGFVAAFDTVTGAELYRRQYDDQGPVGALATSPLGELVFVAFPGTGTVLVIDAFTGEPTGSLQDAGQGIDGIALSADGGTLYVNATLDRQIRAFDVTDLRVPPPLLWSHDTVPEDPLTPEVLRGKQIFHDSRDPRIALGGYISCAACHPGGDHDGQTWDFTGRGEGLRNTSTLLGRAGTGMGPVHWSGNFDEIQDFEHDIRNAFGGTGLMSDADFALADTPLGPPKAGLSADLDALAAYVSTLDQTPASPHPEPPDGAALFAASGCETCHPPPLFTDSALDVRHDVGTLTPASGQRLGGPLDGLDTPTLLGAWDTGPWLHDGSAPTLEAAIAAHDTAPADTAEIEALAAYVRSL
ncbi:MAG: PKD domain-containing protein [Myxococcota bacterium]